MMTKKTPLHILVLAAGRGKRMQSALPKVLHPILYRPMLHHLLDVARGLPHESISVVVGHGEAQVREACAGYVGVNYFTQSEQKGTAHAVSMAEPFLAERGGHTLVLSGDVILLRPETLTKLIDDHLASGAACTVVTAEVQNPKGYGRILRGTDRGVKMIREEVDCSDTERAVREVNSGIYCFRTEDLFKSLRTVKDNNRQKEFYLTDAVAALTSAPGGVRALCLEDPSEMTGINDRLALNEVERILQGRVNRALMLSGVTLKAPETTYIDPHCKIATDVCIEGGCIVVDSTVGPGTMIESGCRIVSSLIAENCHVKQGTYIQESRVDAGSALGPYAHLRPESNLGPGVKIGNFVEIKKSTFGAGAKASHLAYIGDAEIGAEVNLGCGFITCNYDGWSKNKTVIEDGVFVGSDSQTVAPVRLGRGSYVASGTTVTKDVPAGALAISRGRQENKEGYAERLKARRKKK